jgi:hypothetical protein
MVEITIKVPKDSDIKEGLEDFMSTTYDVEEESVFLNMRKGFPSLSGAILHIKQVVFWIRVKNHILELIKLPFDSWKEKTSYLYVTQCPVSSVVRAALLHGEGREFKSLTGYQDI